VFLACVVTATKARNTMSWGKYCWTYHRTEDERITTAE